MFVDLFVEFSSHIRYKLYISATDIKQTIPEGPITDCKNSDCGKPNRLHHGVK